MAGSWGYYRALRLNQATTLTMASRENFSPTLMRRLTASTQPHHLLGPTVHTYSKCSFSKIRSPNYSWLMMLRPLQPEIVKTSWRESVHNNTDNIRSFRRHTTINNSRVHICYNNNGSLRIKLQPSNSRHSGSTPRKFSDVLRASVYSSV